jgi:hypothetical protein
MNITKVSLCLCTLAAGIASAASNYKLTLGSPSVIAGKELKPGDYKVEVDGSNVKIEGNGSSVQTAVKTEQNAKKYDATTVRYSKADGKLKVDEIRIGGTTTKLVFDDSSSTASN